MLEKLFGKPVPRKLSTTIVAAALSLVVAINGSRRLGAQVVVFDPSNSVRIF
jgi:type IV secretion system protein TrbJ